MARRGTPRLGKRPLAPPPEALHRGGSGSPLVLLHGFTDTWRTWSAVLPALEKHHEVFAPTLPGHHGGEAFAEGVPMSIEATADVVERVMDEAGIERAHLAGNSLGGWLALELAVRERALSVLALCPAGGWYHGSPEANATLAYFRRSHAGLRLLTPTIARAIASRPRLRALAFRDVLAHPERLPAPRAAEMLDGAKGCSILLEALEMGARPDAFSDLGPIDCAVTIAYGTRDRLIRWPGHYGRMHELLPDGTKWLALEDVGHMPQWDDPQRVAELVLQTAGSTVSPAS
ncbi:MAG: alpha/beta fold hydrolase [Solirubrobacteraceae bacterium]